MHILVCLSSVPDTTSKIRFKENHTAFDTEGITYVINPYDEFSLTKAVHLKEQKGAKITVLHVGEASAEPNLRKALAIGADHAVRIDTQAKDSAGVAEDIVTYIKSNSFDVLLFGRESIDYNGGMVPGLVAAHLDLPFVNACVGFDPTSETSADVMREIDGGKELGTVSLPCVIAGQKGLVEEKDLKIPAMRGIMMARKKTLEVLPSSSSPSVHFSSYEDLPGKSDCQYIDSENIAQLVEILSNDIKVL